MEETYGTCFSWDIQFIWVKLKVLIGYVSVRLSDLLLYVQFDEHNVDYLAVAILVILTYQNTRTENGAASIKILLSYL
jgi:hypothetical protein